MTSRGEVTVHCEVKHKESAIMKYKESAKTQT